MRVLPNTPNDSHVGDRRPKLTRRTESSATSMIAKIACKHECACIRGSLTVPRCVCQLNNAYNSLNNGADTRGKQTHTRDSRLNWRRIDKFWLGRATQNWFFETTVVSARPTTRSRDALFRARCLRDRVNWYTQLLLLLANWKCWLLRPERNHVNKI